jgi:hypothetical protein
VRHRRRAPDDGEVGHRDFATPHEVGERAARIAAGGIAGERRPGQGGIRCAGGDQPHRLFRRSHLADAAEKLRVDSFGH